MPAVTIVATAVAISTAPAVHADEYDYVSQLDSNGVYYSNILNVIDLGKSSCRQLRMGNPVPSVLHRIVGQGYAGVEAGVIISAAAENMCPDTIPILRSFANQPQPQPPSPFAHLGQFLPTR